MYGNLITNICACIHSYGQSVLFNIWVPRNEYRLSVLWLLTTFLAHALWTEALATGMHTYKTFFSWHTNMSIYKYLKFRNYCFAFHVRWICRVKCSIIKASMKILTVLVLKLHVDYCCHYQCYSYMWKSDKGLFAFPDALSLADLDLWVYAETLYY